MTRIQSAEGAECPEDMDAATPAVRQAAVNLFEAMSERAVQYPEPTPDATLDGLLDGIDDRLYALLHDARAAIHAYVAQREAALREEVAWLRETREHASLCAFSQDRHAACTCDAHLFRRPA